MENKAMYVTSILTVLLIVTYGASSQNFEGSLLSGPFQPGCIFTQDP